MTAPSHDIPALLVELRECYTCEAHKFLPPQDCRAILDYINALTKRAETAEERVVELEEALKPFVRKTGFEFLWDDLPDDKNGSMTFNLGNYRRAARLLSDAKEGRQ